MAEIYFDKINCTFYDDDDEESIKKNIDSLFNLIHQQGLLSLGGINKDRRKYKSYFMKFLKILVKFLESDTNWKFFTQWLKIKRELNDESKYYSFNKALKQIVLASFEFMDGEEEGGEHIEGRTIGGSYRKQN